jgi:hypothetical protein
MSSGNLMEEILTKWSCLIYNRTLVSWIPKKSREGMPREGRSARHGSAHRNQMEGGALSEP